MDWKYEYLKYKSKYLELVGGDATGRKKKKERIKKLEYGNGNILGKITKARDDTTLLRYYFDFIFFMGIDTEKAKEITTFYETRGVIPEATVELDQLNILTVNVNLLPKENLLEVLKEKVTAFSVVCLQQCPKKFMTLFMTTLQRQSEDNEWTPSLWKDKDDTVDTDTLKTVIFARSNLNPHFERYWTVDDKKEIQVHGTIRVNRALTTAELWVNKKKVLIGAIDIFKNEDEDIRNAVHTAQLEIAKKVFNEFDKNEAITVKKSTILYDNSKEKINVNKLVNPETPEYQAAKSFGTLNQLYKHTKTSKINEISESVSDNPRETIIKYGLAPLFKKNKFEVKEEYLNVE